VDVHFCVQYFLGMVSAMPISPVSQVELLMSTFRIPRHRETGVGLAAEEEAVSLNGSLSTQLV
jgi:hypothetical protein